MKQNKTWMSLLLIGLISSMHISGGKEIIEKVALAEYTYVNQTNYDITLRAFISGVEHSSKILTKSELVLSDDLNMGGNLNIPIYSDSVVVNLGGVKNKTWIRSKTSNRNPIELENYENVPSKNTQNAYQFKFMESDFE